MKKGFTLIELLAVIVILGILSIILTSAVFKIIKEVKINAFKSSAYGISEAAYLYAIKNIEDIGDIVTIRYPSDDNALSIKGSDPDYGRVMIEKGSIVSLNLYNIDLNVCAYKSPSDSKIQIVENITAYNCYIYTGEDSEEQINDGDTVIDGWVTLHLYYPDEAYNRMWRLSSEDGIRTSEDDWQEYLGPITIPVNRTGDVWIKYLLDGEEVLVPPAGTALVDISVDESNDIVNQVVVNITYDESASERLYKIGDSDWLEYTGEFTVTENTLIQAKVVKSEDVYNTSGEVVATQTITNTDNYFVDNIGVETVIESLSAPIITRVAPTGSNVAAIEITYPVNASSLIYKLDLGASRNYVGTIQFPTYGHTVTAYYYDIDSKKSKIAIIKIDSNGTLQVAYNQIQPKNIPNALNYSNYFSYPVGSIILDAPTIIKSPTSLAYNITVSVNYPTSAVKKYIKIGDQEYEEYTGAITLNSPSIIKSYYVDANGQSSLIATKKIYNFLESAIDGIIYPSVAIVTNPESSYTGVVNVSILSANANQVYYSTNGYDYTLYTGSFNVTNNCTVYAKAINDNGIKIVKESITNIKTKIIYSGYVSDSITSKVNQYDISISANPNLTGTSTKVDEVTVTINYDSRSTIRKYSIDGINYHNYTEPFEVTSNCTVYAIASSSTGYGEKSKVITGLKTGMSSPVISASPSSKLSSDVEISIEYDNVSVKKYKIDNGEFINYSGPFTVDKNCTIYAVQSDGTTSRYASYSVDNISTKTSIVLIDKSKYYLLKLNYPEQATVKEYKYKEDGTWKDYPSEGILLIKAQYKNEITNGTKVIIKIEDENNKIVTFKGDYYILSGETQSINEAIYMRWDNTLPASPTYLIDSSGYTDRVNVSLISSSKCVLTEYSTKTPNGTQTDYQTYNSPILITENNTTVYGKCKNKNEVYSEVSSYKVINIDQTPPVISNLTSISTPNTIKVSATASDTESGIYKYEFRINNGVWINAKNNYSYTFNGLTKSTSYTIDVRVTNLLGQSSIKTDTFATTSLDEPTITVTNPTVWKSSKTVTLSYPIVQSELLHQYSLDGNNWVTYNEPFVITSNTTVYGRVVDDNGSYSTSSLVVSYIDSTVPTINLNSVPSLVIQGTNYALPTNYSVNTNLSGGTAICKIGTTAYTTTSALAGGYYTINCTVTTGAGVVSTATKGIVVSDTPGELLFVDNIYEIFDRTDLVDNTVYITILSNSTVISVDYHVVNTNTTYSTNPTLCNSTVDKVMCVYKYNGDLTVDSGVTLTPQTRKKGFIIGVTGTLINNGTITMTDKGAIASGQNVLLYKNASGTYEYIPATGGAGGTAVTAPNSGYGGSVLYSGRAGVTGTIRKTGGGGSGAAGCNVSGTAVSGAGGAGTSYSGGSGGGGSIYRASSAGYGGAGSSAGGAGGAAYSSRYSSWYTSGGGAGNSGGLGKHYSTASLDVNYSGDYGTGGLLVIYANNITNSGTINSNGSAGGAGTASGGSSGGGSINIFYKSDYTSTGSITATGGVRSNGGSGGSGSITIGSINTSTFVSN